jgi:hypothetical protein
MNLFKGFRERKAAKDWSNSPVGQALAAHTRECFFTGETRLSSFKEDAKKEIINDFYTKIFALPNATNPFLAVRELIANYVLAFASIQVLTLKPEEKTDAFYAGCPYISGELYKHIQAAADHHAELKQLKWTHDSLSDEELMSFCNTRGAVLLYYVNGLNIVRRADKDFDANKDWFRPFIKSMLIWQEDTYRRNLGLPPLLPDPTAALEYSAFLNAVTNGAPNPYYDWATTFPEAASSC